ncbi:MAG: nucleotidyltransferase family protein, partial [Anaerolineaceae bacterium]|nr:nucleotidyltransferase family protein [Anaerolineaceae bacterium]
MSSQSQTEQHNIAGHPEVAGIILAAGGATRYQQPKILLPWIENQSIIRHIGARAVASRLSNVIVVLGANIEPVVEQLSDLPIKFIINHNWSSGQSSSIRVGLQAINQTVSACIFLLADQPFISTTLVNGLIDKYMETNNKIIMPMVGTRRANPVLFDRSLFEELSSLDGDIGGRSLFAKYPPTLMAWDDPR